MRDVKSNGGTLKAVEKGDPAPPGAGRPQGSVSFKTIANKILDGSITKEAADGLKLKMTRREAMVLGVIEDAVNDEDPTVRLRALLGIWDRLESKPPLEVDMKTTNITNGGEMSDAQLAALKAASEIE
jgi:hypothetical protein